MDEVVHPNIELMPADGGQERVKMRIWPDNDKLIFSGRIDWDSPKEPVFVYPCTSVRLRFTGNTLTVCIRNQSVYWSNYLGCILDGKQTAVKLPKEGEASLKIEVERTELREHDALLFKRQDACHEFALLGMEIGEGERLLTITDRPGRRMEVYGDSVSAGEVSEAVDFVGKEDPQHDGEYSNSWYSYAWIKYLFRRGGTGTPGHLRIPEAEEMAEELAAYIETLEIEGWD